MNTKPKALQLAEWIEGGFHRSGDSEIAAELRRLHDDNEKLREENSKIYGWLLDAEQHIAILKNIRARSANR